MTDVIKAFLNEKIDPDFIILFGSYATGETHPGSDVDIAFFKENSDLSAYDVFIMAQELASELKVEKVDLIDLKSNTSTVFRAQIIATGKLLHARDINLFYHFQTTTLSMYANFDLERKPILEAIRKRGRIYGY